MKVILAVIAMVLLLATTTKARELLDYYDNCYNGVLLLMVELVAVFLLTTIK